jgi:hypothetical protein
MADNEHSSTEGPSGYPTEAFAVRLETPDGSLKGKVSVYTGPTPLAGLVPPLLALTDGLVGLTLARGEKEGRHASCRPGCGWCCHQMIPLAMPEAFFLCDVVAALPADRRRVILSRYDSVVSELETSGLYARIMDRENTDEDYQKIAQEYFYLRLPCPFLEQSHCSIYPMRPAVCRDYHVTTPPEWCADPRSFPVSNLKPQVAVPVVLTRLSADLLGVQVQMIPLALALRWAGDHPDFHRRTWPGKELLAEFLVRFNAPA